MDRLSRLSRTFRRALLAALIAATMISQTAGMGAAAGITGTISGTVTNSANNTPLEGVKINVASPTGNASATTNAKGFYSITGLTVDTYTVSFQLSGFEPASTTGVTVFADQIQDVSAKLQKSLSTIGRVTSRGGGGAFQPKQTQDTYSVTASQVETILGRADAISESNLLASLPGATFDSSGYPVLRGGRENEEGFQNEGIDQTDAFTSQFVNSLALNPSLSSLQLTPGAGDASSGNAGTGSINLTAKRGTYPGFGSIQGTVQSPDFDHELGLEYGFASPDGRISDYFSFEGTRSAGATYGRNADARQIGRFFSVTDTNSNDFVNNFVYKFGHDNSQSLQLYFEGEQVNFYNTFGGNNGLFFKSNDPFYLANAEGFTGLSAAQTQALTGLLPFQASATSPLDKSPEGFYQPNSTVKLQYSDNIDSSTFVTAKYYAISANTIFDFPFNGESVIGFPSFYLTQGGHRTGFAADATKQIGSLNLLQAGVKYELLSPTYDQVDPADGFWATVFSGNIYDFVPNVAAPTCPFGVNGGCGYLFNFTNNPGPVPYNDEQSSTIRQDFSTYITDTISPNDRVKIQAGVRLDGSHYRFASGASEFYAPAKIDANGFPLDAAGNEVTSDTGAYLTNVTTAQTQPLVIEPRLSGSWQLGANDAVRASYGRSVELPALAFVDFQQGMGQFFGRFSGIPANAATCGITGNLTCRNYGDELYWANQNFLEGVPYQPVKPATFNNYDFSYSHQFAHNIGLKLTPFYRRGYDALALVASPRTGSNGAILTNPDGSPVLGPLTTTNLGVNRTTGIEFLVTKEAPVGFSGSFSATYINETSNVIPNSPSEDFFPSIPPASLALGDQYRVGFLSPFQATLAVQYKSKGGLRINPQIYYNRGYGIGEGLLTATFINGKAFNVPNTNVTDPNGSTSAQQYVDPQNPGTLLNPNVAVTRGVGNLNSAGGVLGNPSVFGNLTVEFSKPGSRGTFGIQILNIAGNVYSALGGGAAVSSNTRYQPVATGISGPLSGYNLSAVTFPSLGIGYHYGLTNNGQDAYLIRPVYEGTQLQAYYNLKL